MPRKQMKWNNEIKFCLWYFSLDQNKVYCAWQWTAREGKCSSFFFLCSGLHHSTRRKMQFLEVSYLPTKDKHWRSSNLLLIKVHPKCSPIPSAAWWQPCMVLAMRDGVVALPGPAPWQTPKTPSTSSKPGESLSEYHKGQCQHKKDPAIDGPKPSGRSQPVPSWLQLVWVHFLPEDTKGPDKFDHNSLQGLPRVKYPGKAGLTRSCAINFPGWETELKQTQLRAATGHRLEIRDIF